MELTRFYRLGLYLSLLFGMSTLACGGLTHSSRVNEATATAHAENIQVLATRSAQALQGTPQPNIETQELETLETYRQWPLVMQEFFEENKRGWPTGADNDSLSDVNQEIGAGSYTWEMTAHQGFVYWVNPEMDLIDDFYMRIEVQHLDGPSDTSYGAVFRQMNSHTYYLFRIDSESDYLLTRGIPGDSVIILPWEHSDAIRPYESNIIEIIGVGNHFAFYVNDQFVAEAYDNYLKFGHNGLSVAIYTTGEKARVVFKSFELREPPVNQGN